MAKGMNLLWFTWEIRVVIFQEQTNWWFSFYRETYLKVIKLFTYSDTVIKFYFHLKHNQTDIQFFISFFFQDMKNDDRILATCLNLCAARSQSSTNKSEQAVEGKFVCALKQN